MIRKSSTWFIVLISAVTIGFITSGCSKKQLVKEEATSRSVTAVAKETPMEAPKAEEVAPVEPPKEEAVVEAAKPEGQPTPIDLVALRIQFAFDDYNLSTRSKENLENIASWIKSHPRTKIRIEGHTCDLGTGEYNLALGERRATSALRYLEGLGVESAILSTISYGEERPRVPNTDEKNRSMNRRDEFVVIK
jgi:peptidoglycan-associated lipoprotein